MNTFFRLELENALLDEKARRDLLAVLSHVGEDCVDLLDPDGEASPWGLCELLEIPVDPSALFPRVLQKVKVQNEDGTGEIYSFTLGTWDTEEEEIRYLVMRLNGGFVAPPGPGLFVKRDHLEKFQRMFSFTPTD